MLESTQQSENGAIRLVSLRLNNRNQADDEQIPLQAAKFVNRFLSSQITYPFKYKKMSATSFAILAQEDSADLLEYAKELNDRLTLFLFGTENSKDCEALFYVGSDQDVAKFITEPEANASERSRSFMRSIETARAPKEDLSRELKPVRGKRPILYRGVLACPHRVMLAYMMTPSAKMDESGSRHADLPLTSYFDFRGNEAMDFSIRMFDKASYWLQTSDDAMRNTILVVPISYKSLLSKNDRKAFMDNVADHPDWVREKMFLSIIGAPENPSSSTMQRFVAEFSNSFNTIDWQVPNANFELDLFIGCKLHSITLDLYQAKTNRQKTLDQFLARVSEMRRRQIRPGVAELQTLPELSACLNSKVIYASGNAVTGALAAPALAQQIELHELPIEEATVLNTGQDAA